MGREWRSKKLKADIPAGSTDSLFIKSPASAVAEDPTIKVWRLRWNFPYKTPFTETSLTAALHNGFENYRNTPNTVNRKVTESFVACMYCLGSNFSRPRSKSNALPFYQDVEITFALPHALIPKRWQWISFLHKRRIVMNTDTKIWNRVVPWNNVRILEQLGHAAGYVVTMPR